MKKGIKLVLIVSLLVIGVLCSFGVTNAVIDNPPLLWTTDAAGLGEINEFVVGDDVYLKTADDYVGQPLAPGTYRIYIFRGVINPVVGDDISTYGTPLGLTPLDVETTSNGEFGKPVVAGWATPVLIWPNVPFTPPFDDDDLYTVILDQIKVGVGPSAVAAPNQGKWGLNDYRDDLCTAIPTPPSFHVIPEVAVGTIVVLTAMFGSLGIYTIRKHRNN